MVREFTLHQQIRLRGKTQRGKGRIVRWGQNWFVTSVGTNRISIVAKSDTTASEPIKEFGGVHFRSLPDSFRWIDLPTDPDFEILQEN